jgi:predicted small lipoprotein YifL
MIRPLILLATASALAIGLGACGKQGDLERPAPMWGAAAKAEYEAQRRQQADTKTREAQGSQIETLPDEGPGSDPNTNPAPIRSNPIQGTRPDPFGAGQPGAMPDPYNRPQ